MRPLRWDDGTRWDDPNARWGDDGSYVLEPGDPGYVVPPPDPEALPKPKPNHRTMSSNATPTNRIILTSLAHNIHDGQVTYAASVGLLHHLAPGMLAALKNLEGDPAAPAGSAANKGSQLTYRQCVDATGAAEAALRTLSDGPVKTWLDGYRKILEGMHGRRSNSEWQTAGFPPGSTAVPRGHNARQALLNAARSFIGASPGYEATLPQPGGTPLEINANTALALHTQMQTAKTLINTSEAAQVAAKGVRDADVDALFEEVSETIAELRDLLAEDDARWESFGLNIPANPNPPLGVASLTITPAGTGRELLTWPYAVRAEYYRVFVKRGGVDADFINLADAKDLEYTLKDLAPGSTLAAYIVPANDGGQGPASPTVTKVVGG